MPGRSAAQAREAFLEPLRRALSCVTDAQLYVSRKSPGEVEALALSEDPFRLRARVLGDVYLVLGHLFRLVNTAGDGWHVSTEAYEYRLDDAEGKELVAWHWHPKSGLRYPHVHVNAGALGRRAHLPSGRVSIEAIFRLLLTDLGVPPRRDDFLEVLEACERPFIQYRRWHG